MGTHSRLAPSSASIWGPAGGCTGYVSMVERYPGADNEHANEGRRAHDLAAKYIMLLTAGEAVTTDPFQAEHNVPNEMSEAVTEYVVDVYAVMRAHSIYGGPHFNIEQRVNATRINPESYGTPDMWIYDEKTAQLFIWDFKYGHGIVEVFENWQLINYAAGILDILGVNGISDQYITVDMRVAQPRAFHSDGPIRSWRVKASDLRGYFNQLEHNAAIALSDKAELRTGNHCRYCPARHACPAAQRAAMASIDYLAAPTGEQLPPEAVGLELRLIRRAQKALEYRETGLAAEAESMIRAGTPVPGFGLKPTSSRLKWDKPVEEVTLLGDMMGTDVRKPDLITPLRAIKAGLDENLVNAYASRESGNKLVEDDGTRAREIFSSNPIGETNHE